VVSRRFATAALLCLMTAAAQAQVSLQGVLGSKALLIVNGSDPKMLAVGETFQGAKLVSASGDQAVVEVDGSRHTLRVGDSPARVAGRAANSAGSGGNGGNGSVIVLPVGQGGHFTTEGAINGAAVRFMVDTGATSIALSEADARRIGLDYKSGRLGHASTANGPAPMWQLTLASVRIGDVEVRDVEASVLPATMPFVLLGNSFLNRFRMRRDNDTMVLERRY
jgi:aspartyl protease family protein